jgi:hypothetical protein
MGAVGNHPMAIDNSLQYRPHESPANSHIVDDAGDADGTLRRLLGTSFFFRDLLSDQGPFKAALNVFVPEERALEDLGT